VFSGIGLLSAPVASVDGDYISKGPMKMGVPIANVSGGGSISATAAAVYLPLM
jgi:hypothetical protein